MSNRLPFQVVNKNAFRAIGLELSGPYSALKEMGNLWQTFTSRMPEIQARVNPESAVMYGLTQDRPTDFTYFAAVEVSDEANVPAGMKEICVPPQTYAVFTHQGPLNTLHNTIVSARQTLEEALHTLVPDAFWFEHYDERFDPTSRNCVLDLYFPIG